MRALQFSSVSRRNIGRAPHLPHRVKVFSPYQMPDAGFDELLLHFAGLSLAQLPVRLDVGWVAEHPGDDRVNVLQR
jgi:hypothetical protein